jgi:hypothetical protein
VGLFIILTWGVEKSANICGKGENLLQNGGRWDLKKHLGCGSIESKEGIIIDRGKSF